jgi:hypothetical protein
MLKKNPTASVRLNKKHKNVNDRAEKITSPGVNILTHKWFE